MTQYIAVEAASGRIVHGKGRRDPEGFEGVPDLRPFPRGGLVFYPYQEPLIFTDDNWPTGHLHWVDGEVVRLETAALEDLKAQTIAKTYADVDAVYIAAVGMRTPEYEEAEVVARAYLAAEVKPSPASEYITSHALNNPTGLVQSETWAAQQIVERADAFSWAKRQMRSVRFARQTQIRAATTHAELAAAVAEWDEFIAWLRDILAI